MPYLARTEAKGCIEGQFRRSTDEQILPQQIPEAIIQLQKSHVAVIRIELVPSHRFLLRFERPSGCEDRRGEFELHDRGQCRVSIQLGGLTSPKYVDSNKDVQFPSGIVIADEVLRSLQVFPAPCVVQKNTITGSEETVIQTVQFVLPAEETFLGDGIVPDNQAAWDAFV